MFKCEGCGHVFEQAKRQSEYRGECHGRPAYEEWDCCPRCGGPEISPAAHCVGCVQVFRRSELTEGFCDTCGVGIEERFFWLVEKMEIGGAERAYIRAMLEDSESFLVTLGLVIHADK